MLLRDAARGAAHKMHGCTKGGRGSGGKGALASLCWSPFCPSHTVLPPPPPPPLVQVVDEAEANMAPADAVKLPYRVLHLPLAFNEK